MRLAAFVVEGVLLAEKTGAPVDWVVVEYFRRATPDLLRRFRNLYTPDVERKRVCYEIWLKYRDAADKLSKSGSRRARDVGVRRFFDYFGTDVFFEDLDSEKLHAFQDALLAKYAVNTARKTVGYLRAFANWAIRQKFIAENPFLMLDKQPVRVHKRERYVPADWTPKILAACPSQSWRAMYCLWRHAGLRRQEVFELTLDCVNLEANRLRVPSPKTEHIRGEEDRVVPISPILKVELIKLLEEHPHNTEYLLYRNRCVDVWGSFKEIIERAGFPTWPRLCQALRASCENDWVARGFPCHVVAAWMGHTVRTQAAHYLQVLPDYFDAASENGNSPVGRSFQGDDRGFFDFRR